MRIRCELGLEPSMFFTAVICFVNTEVSISSTVIIRHWRIALEHVAKRWNTGATIMRNRRALHSRKSLLRRDGEGALARNLPAG